MAKVLVITSGNDPHVGMVQEYLDGSFVQFDPKVPPLEQALTYRWNNGSFDIFLNGTCVSDVETVWFRKPLQPESTAFSVAEVYRKFVAKSWAKATKAVYALLQDCLWVSDPWLVLKANNKLWQLEEASKVGFNVPETLVTNSPKDAMQFRAKVGDIITKALSAELIWSDDTPHLVFTARIPKGENIDLSGLAVSPAIFQAEVSKGVDLRVTVVADIDVFACEIHQSGKYADEIDWRKGICSTDLTYVPHTLPSGVRQKCVQLVRNMGLQFGAIDLILDPEGDYWFIENNPNGQWGFVELETGLPIAKALAELFTRGRS